MITYKRHPIDNNMNYLGIDKNQNIIFDGYLIGGKLWFVDVYSSKGRWDGRQIARFNIINYRGK